MLQYRNKMEELVGYVNQHREYFSKLDLDTYHAVQAFLNSETRLRQVMKDESEEDEIDMCKALQDLYEEGIEQGIRELIVRKYRKGVSIEEIADFVEMPCEKVQEIVEE